MHLMNFTRVLECRRKLTDLLQDADLEIELEVQRYEDWLEDSGVANEEGILNDPGPFTERAAQTFERHAKRVAEIAQRRSRRADISDVLDTLLEDNVNEAMRSASTGRPEANLEPAPPTPPPREKSSPGEGNGSSSRKKKSRKRHKRPEDQDFNIFGEADLTLSAKRRQAEKEQKQEREKRQAKLGRPLPIDLNSPARETGSSVLCVRSPSKDNQKPSPYDKFASRNSRGLVKPATRPGGGAAPAANPPPSGIRKPSRHSVARRRCPSSPPAHPASRESTGRRKSRADSKPRLVQRAPPVVSGSVQSENEDISPTKKLLMGLNDDEDDGCLATESTFMSLLKKKEKPKPKLVIPALEKAKRAKEREEKRRLAKEKARHGQKRDPQTAPRPDKNPVRRVKQMTGKKRPSELAGGPARKRPRALENAKGVARANRGSFSFGHSKMAENPRQKAARDRRNRIQQEQKTRLLKTQQSKHKRRQKLKHTKHDNRGGEKSKKKRQKSKSKSEFKKPQMRPRRLLTCPKTGDSGRDKANEEAFKKYKALVERITLQSSYVLSDFDSDDDDMSGDDSDAPGDKKIPSWARKKFFIELTEATSYIDPDRIFGTFVNQSIDLSELYKNAPPKKRYVKRHPSGDWSQDRLTADEEANYKLQMGYSL